MLGEFAPRLNRREVLNGIGAVLSVSCLPRQVLCGGPQPSQAFPVEPRARLALTSYPFRASISSPTNRGRNPNVPGMDMTEFPGFAAEKFDIHNINPLLDHFSSTDSAYIDSFRAALDRAHSHIVDLGLSGKRFFAADQSVRQEAVAFGKKCIDAAVQIGSPSVRQHLAGHAGERPDVALAAASLGEMAEYGAKKNIVVILENDAPGSEDPYFLAAIIDKVSSPYLRGLPDFGNSLIGHDTDYNRDAVKAMLLRAYNMCHVKETVQGEGGKQYKVDLASMFELARSTSYRGYFSMEFDTQGGDAVAGTQRLVETTLKYLR